MPAPSPHSSPDRRQRRSTELRTRLFRAALDLFAKQGFAETTVEDITSAADVGKGTFFNYFPSKDHLLIAFGDMQLEKLQALVTEAAETDASLPAFLRTLGVRMTEEPARNPSIVRALLQGNLVQSLALFRRQDVIDGALVGPGQLPVLFPLLFGGQLADRPKFIPPLPPQARPPTTRSGAREYSWSTMSPASSLSSGNSWSAQAQP